MEGGALNPAQPDLLRSAMKRLPSGGQIILAFDNDPAGQSLIEKLKAIFGDLRGEGLEINDDDAPLTPGEDWNDALRASMAEISHATDSPDG